MGKARRASGELTRFYKLLVEHKGEKNIATKDVEKKLKDAKGKLASFWRKLG